MAYLLEKGGSSRCTLEATKVEPFTQKPFSEMIRESHSRSFDYYLARVQCEGTKPDKPPNRQAPYYCYDARQLCKYIFEMVISTEGRRIRIKNFKDPINQQQIGEISFFRIRYDSDTPLRAEYVGNQIDFLDSNCFRSKIFYQEDALDALTVNFQFKMAPKIPLVNKRRMFTAFAMLVMLILFVSMVILLAEKDAFRSFKVPPVRAAPKSTD
jgi:hypothetical protein